MGFGDVGLSGLRAILGEAGILNGNLVGANRNAYKASTHTYGGSGSNVNGSLQTPDQSLITSSTSIDFSQGQIVGTGEQTDMAIAGEGFFLMKQIQDVGVPNSPNFLSRDGSFRFTDVPSLGGSILTTNNGLAVLRDASGTGAGPYTAILKSDFNNNNFRPSIVSPDNGVDSLKFSNKGSTVYEFTGSFSKGDGILQEGSIETSNVDSKESLVAMSLNSKKFQAMAAQLKNEQTNLDVVLGLIK